MCSNADNCIACEKSKRKIDHPNGEEHFGGHPHKTGETEDDCGCPSTIDVDYRFFDPDRDIDLVKWYADKITYAETTRSTQIVPSVALKKMTRMMELLQRKISPCFAGDVSDAIREGE